MKTVQRLNKYQSLSVYDYESTTSVDIAEIESNSGWYIDSGPGTLVFSGDNYFASGFHNIKIIATGSSSIVLRLDFDEENSPFENDDIGQNFVFTCVLQCTQGSPDVNAKLSNFNGSAIDGNTREILGGYWDAVRSNVMTLTSLDYEEDSYGITVTISNHSPNPGQFSTIYVSTPNLVNDSAWANNPVIQNMRPYIPDLYESYDSQETDPTWPFFRLVDVLTDAIADTMFIYAEWFQHYSSELPANFDQTDISTRSRLVNYLYVSDEYAPWLAQFSGNRLVKQLYTSSGSSIVSDASGFQEKQLFPAIYGRGAGTQGALINATKFVLTGDKKVVVSQRYDAGSGSSPWNIRVTTVASETPGVDYRGPVKVATTANITIATALNSGDTIDGIVLSNGDKVLVKNQSTSSQNGVYTVSATPTRSTDFDTGWDGTTGEIKHGAVWYVEQGSVNGDKSFTTTIAGGGNVTVGTTAIDFIQFAGSEEVLEVLEDARPMGYKIYHSIVDEFTLTLGDSTFGVLGTAIL